MLRSYIGFVNPKNSFGFEPCHDNYRSAKKRCPNSKIFNVAVSDYDGEAELNVYDTKSRHSLLTRNESDLKTVQQTKVIRLDTWAAENSITSLDFVKIDTQGLDYNVMVGMGELIKTVRILIAEVMFSDDEYANVPPYYKLFEYAETHGLRLHSFRDVYHEPNGVAVAVDAVFLNEETMRLVTK